MADVILDILKNQIKNIDDNIKELNKYRLDLMEAYRKNCKHNIEPSYTFYEYMKRPEHFKAHFECNDCDLYYKDGDEDYNSYNQQLLVKCQSM